MSTLDFRKFAVGTSFLFVLAVGSAKGGIPADPGTPVAGAPGFLMIFDENGHATINGQPVPGTPVPGGGVDYPLPVPVAPGSVGVFTPGDASDSNPNGFSDLLTFSINPLNNQGVLLYESLLDDSSPPDLADVLRLVQPTTPFSVTETGPEGNNGFVWSSPIDPTKTVYQGISDIPEPSTFILGTLGLMILALLGWRRQRGAAALPESC
jgi:hypothetical protein